MQKVPEQIQEDIKPLLGKSKMANYIPALENINPKKFSLPLCVIARHEAIFQGLSGTAKDCFTLFAMTGINITC